ncbi:thioesterase domain-containing protein [Frankia sp. AiPs1]|nr:thioesterase domain-containing protein [Frankia sp. AiPs1]
MHPGLGLSWSYAGLLRYLGPQRAVYGLQATEIDTGVPPTVRTIAERYADVVAAAEPSGPIHLLGWSLGAVLAHAVACELEARGREVPSIVMLDGYPDLDGTPDLDGVPELDGIPDLDGIPELDGAAAGGQGAAPGGSASAEPVNTVSRFLHTLLQRSGHPVDDLHPDEVTPAVAHALAERTGSLLTGAGERRLGAVARSLLAVASVDTGVKPRLYGGRVEFVRALPEAGETPADPTDWAPYVAGGLRVHAVDVVHEDLLSPAALPAVGPLVAGALRP